jgi:hypothetical protein
MVTGKVNPWRKGSSAEMLFLAFILGMLIFPYFINRFLPVLKGGPTVLVSGV